MSRVIIYGGVQDMNAARPDVEANVLRKGSEGEARDEHGRWVAGEGPGLKEGDKATYRDHFGREHAVTIAGRGEKDGRRLYDHTFDHAMPDRGAAAGHEAGEMGWGYTHQYSRR